jgi:peptide/nickel transport system ATP-binding protein
MPDALLGVDALSIAYRSAQGETRVVQDLTFRIDEGEIVGLVGESGSGKTSVALALLNYLPRGGHVVAGGVRYRGKNLLTASRRELRHIYGRRIAHVAQDPASSLNPALRVGLQIEEGMLRHLGISSAEARRRALALLQEVHLRDGNRILQGYPHMLSGGMQQRVCIAMALSCDPDLIVMDEPTTGLDASTEAAIFDLLRELKARRRVSVLFISHNLAAVRGMADRVVIMYGGRCMESGSTGTVFGRPLHRYTQMLLDSLPTMRGAAAGNLDMPWQAARAPAEGCPFRDRCDLAQPECGQEPVLVEVGQAHGSACRRWKELPVSAVPAPAPVATIGEADGGDVPPSSNRTAVIAVRDLTHRYRSSLLAAHSRATRLSLDHVSFDLRAGEVLAIIGESGSGKTTMARCLVGLARPLSGSILVGATDVAPLRQRPLEIARNVQIVFQNIAGSLHPRKRVRAILERPFLLYERHHATGKQLRDLAHSVGLRAELLDKRTGRLSGGERQRAALARAFAPRPAVIVLDEAFSALDVSMKMKVRNLLQQKQAELDASYLLISHDLPLVRSMAGRVLVLFQGWVCEVGLRRIIEAPPYHPYTETLVWSALALESLKPSTLETRPETPASEGTSGTGCRFHPRCPRKLGIICEREDPPQRLAGPDHTIACHIPVAELATLQRAEWVPRRVAEAVS